LYVCSVNLCRSVLAERLSARDLAAGLGAEAARLPVGSAGTDGEDGLPMHPYTADALIALGADTAAFSSRRLTGELVDDADLILTAGLTHRSAVVATRPDASRRTFMIREFARLGRHVPRPAAADLTGRASQIVAGAARLRGRIPWVEPVSDEIADPAVRGPAFFACAQAISGSVADVLQALFGTSRYHDV
jgi:protein-tyrosine phosphatase